MGGGGESISSSNEASATRFLFARQVDDHHQKDVFDDGGRATDDASAIKTGARQSEQRSWRARGERPDKKKHEQEEEGKEKGGDGGEGEGEGKGKDGGEEEEEVEPSVLEKILPTFPAAWRQVFVQVEAVSGLVQPFAAKGHVLSARVFWNGQEVRTRTS